MFKLGLQTCTNEITIDRIFFDLYIYFGGTGISDLVRAYCIRFGNGQNRFRDRCQESTPNVYYYYNSVYITVYTVFKIF